MLLRIGIIGGFIFVFATNWFEKSSYYTVAVLFAFSPMMVARDLAAMIATHPVAAGQPLAEIEKYLWQGFPGFVAKLCAWVGVAVVTLRVLVWFIYLRH